VDPTTPRLHERLAVAALATGHVDEAERELAAERRAEPRNPQIELLETRVREARQGSR
jgi:hypothetical protein